MRAIYAVRAWRNPPGRVADAATGWRATSNVSKTVHRGGQYGTIRYSTNELGFRTWGDVKSKHTKILVVGDSFTQAASVSDGHASYDQFKSAAVEVFATGSGGHGTLQEFIVLDEIFDRINPDVVLLQICANDLVNNCHAFESLSVDHNNMMDRPYWEDGRVRFRYPHNRKSRFLRNLFFFRLTRASYLLLAVRYKIVRHLPHGKEILERSLADDHPAVRQAVSVTIELLRRMKRRVGNARFVAFSVNPEGHFPYYMPSVLCAEAGVQYIPGAAEAVEKAKVGGLRVDWSPGDWHWNENGHHIAGTFIRRYLEHAAILADATPRP